jgi:hypothetical protein
MGRLGIRTKGATVREVQVEVRDPASRVEHKLNFREGTPDWHH